MLKYDGEVAVITGGGRGIGAEYAKMLAARGCRVVVNDLGIGVSGEPAHESPADELVAQIRRAGGSAIANASDIVTDSNCVVDAALAEYGRLDILINNAGILSRNGFEDVSESQLRQALDIHVVGAFLMAQKAWPHLKDAGRGRMLFTSSGGIWGVPGSVAYATAKASIIGLVNTLALEGEEHGIRVCGLMPAAGTRMIALPGQKHTAMIQDVMQERFAPEHIAAFVTWLLHRDSAPSGDIFSVGGGRAARVSLNDVEGAMISDLQPESWLGREEQIRDVVDSHDPSSAAESLQYRLAAMGIDAG